MTLLRAGLLTVLFAVTPLSEAASWGASGETEAPGRLWTRAADLDVDEPSLLQTDAERGRINRYAGIAGVELTPFGAIDAIDADE